MVKERKIRCDCGAVMKARQARFEEFETEAMVCPKCSFATLTKEQAQHYVKLKQMHRVVDAERRIIMIGNSMGFTLPEGLKEFGIKVGKRVRTEALGPDSFKVVI